MGRYVARAAVFAALIGLAAAGCASNSSSSASSGGGSTSPAASGSAVGKPSAPAATTAAPFQAIVEPWAPGHPAQATSGPADCGSQPSTLAIEQCYQAQTETIDAQINTVQQGAYASASASAQATILAQDSAWLAARGPVCQAAFNGGGTIDGISIAACLLDESTARLDAVKNVTAPEAKLKGTDSQDPNDFSWYTTPEGSRIAEIDTQGDQTGGAVIAWVIIGGAQGFVINPKQFFFQDGSFTDPGVIQGTDPTYHKVAPGAMFTFGIDYSKLAQDPNANQSAAGYVYAPGSPIAIWQ